MPRKKEQLIDVRFVCPMCKKEHYLYDLPESKVERVINRRETGEYIQDIFPELSANNREKFITGYCDKCQEKIFAEPEED